MEYIWKYLIDSRIKMGGCVTLSLRVVDAVSTSDNGCLCFLNTHEGSQGQASGQSVQQITYCRVSKAPMIPRQLSLDALIRERPGAEDVGYSPATSSAVAKGAASYANRLAVRLEDFADGSPGTTRMFGSTILPRQCA